MRRAVSWRFSARLLILYYILPPFLSCFILSQNNVYLSFRIYPHCSFHTPSGLCTLPFVEFCWCHFMKMNCIRNRIYTLWVIKICTQVWRKVVVLKPVETVGKCMSDLVYIQLYLKMYKWGLLYLHLHILIHWIVLTLELENEQTFVILIYAMFIV